MALHRRRRDQAFCHRLRAHRRYRATLALLLSSTALAAPLLLPTQAVAQVVPDPRQWGLYAIGAPTAWAAGYTGAGVTVAIGDSGIETTHPAFAGKIDARSRNFVASTPGGVVNPTDISYLVASGYPFPLNIIDHGVHMAGVAAASATSLTPGVAYDAGLVILRDLSGDSEKIDQAIDYFAGLSGVNVINLSWAKTLTRGGYTVWPTETINPLHAAAALNATAAGKIIVNAIGNDRLSDPVAGLNARGIALLPFIQPAHAGAGVYDDGGHNYDFSALLDQPGLIIAATAVASDKTISAFANMCGVTASWCVAAPGGSVNRAFDGIWSTFAHAHEPSGYGPNVGTSEAGAFVTGSLAVLEQAYPGYNARDIAHVLFATAENVGGQPAVNAIYGYGLIRLDRAIAGPTSLAAGAAVDVGIVAGSPDMNYWSQPLTTSGSFEKTGAGSLIIAGRTIASGDVTVGAGALGVDGTLTIAAGHRLVVDTGATLAGFGWIVGDTVVNGTLAAGQLPNYQDLIANNGGTLPAGIPLAGTSPGTLTFAGDVALGAGATMRVNVDGTLSVPGGPGTYDKFVVTGSGHTFTANGVLAPVLRDIPGGTNNYSPVIGSRFVFVTAQGGILGSFTSLAQPAGLAAGTRFDALYTANAITLTVTPQAYANLAAAGLSQTASQTAVGAVLDASRPAVGIAMTAAQASVYAPLYGLSAGGVGAALEQLAPSIYGDALSVRRDAWHLVGNAIGDQLEARRGLRPSGTAQAVGAGGRHAWITGLGRFGTVSENGAAGYRDTIGGIAAGIDMPVSPGLTVGAAFGFTDQSVSAANAASLSGDAFQFEIYGSLRQGAAFLDVHGGGGYAEVSVERLVSAYGMRAAGDVHGASAGGSLRAGFRFEASGWQIEPSVTLAGVHLDQDSVAETQGGVAAATVDDASFSSLQTLAAARAERRMPLAGGMAMTPSVQIGWLHEHLDTAAAVTASLSGLPTPFTVSGAATGRDAAVVGVRSTLEVSAALSAYVGYTGIIATSSDAHTLTGGLRWIF